MESTHVDNKKLEHLDSSAGHQSNTAPNSSPRAKQIEPGLQALRHDPPGPISVHRGRPFFFVAAPRPDSDFTHSSTVLHHRYSLQHVKVANGSMETLLTRLGDEIKDVDEGQQSQLLVARGKHK